MAKSYWISAYRSIRDPEALGAYAKLAGPALEAAGGRFLARGLPARVYEGGVNERIVILEFADTAAFKRWYNSPEYQKILPGRLDNSTARSFIVEGVS